MHRCSHGMNVSTAAVSFLPLSDVLTCYTFGYSKTAVTDTEHEDILCFCAQFGRNYVNISRTIAFSNKASYDHLHIKKKREWNHGKPCAKEGCISEPRYSAINKDTFKAHRSFLLLSISRRSCLPANFVIVYLYQACFERRRGLPVCCPPSKK
jgi:hypothetical protein